MSLQVEGKELRYEIGRQGQPGVSGCANVTQYSLGEDLHFKIHM
jgi:hypothetical protein